MIKFWKIPSEIRDLREKYEWNERHHAAALTAAANTEQRLRKNLKEALEGMQANARIVDQLHETLAQAQSKRADLEAMLKATRQERDDAARRVGKIIGFERWLKDLQEFDSTDPQIQAALTLAHDDNQLWRVLLTLLTRQFELETEYTLRTGLSNEDAHYYRGRAAGLFEYRAALLIRRQLAQEPQKEQGEP